MCGRLNITDDPLSQLVSETLGISFNAIANEDLRPSENVATIFYRAGQIYQQDAAWGIKPNWSPKLLINAKAETASEKATFKAAFNQSRCLIPCSGWYEWKTESGKKVKYQFSHTEHAPFYMAGMLFNPSAPKFVSLTTSPTKPCADIHHRMPVLIDQSNIDYWFNASTEQLSPLLQANHALDIKIKRVS